MASHLMTLIVVKFANHDIPDAEFRNAEVAIAPPGVFVIQNDHGQLAMFPIPAVAGILYPEGPSRITEVTLQ